MMPDKPMKIIAVQPCYKTSFPAHNEMMKQFRRSHGKVATVNQTGANNHDTLAATTPLTIKRIHGDGGGSYLPGQISGLRSSLSLPRVAGYKLSAN